MKTNTIISINRRWKLKHELAIVLIPSLCPTCAAGRRYRGHYLWYYRPVCHHAWHGFCCPWHQRAGPATGAAAGLLADNNPLAGALLGTLVFASIIGLLGVRERERDSVIGVILAFGLGVGVLLLSFYHGFASEATDILSGNIFGVSNGQLLTY